MPWKWKIRLIRHNRMVLYCYWLGWVTRVVTFSRYAHVCFGFDGVVSEVTANRDTNFWPLLQFASDYPAVHGMYVIHTKRSVNMRRYETRKRPPSPWRSFLKLFTFGMVQISEDCVDLSKNALAQAGVIVPRRVITPGGLHRWLRGQGYAWTELTTNNPTNARKAVDS